VSRWLRALDSALLADDEWEAGETAWKDRWGGEDDPFAPLLDDGSHDADDHTH
jgi:hypothetical protein